MPDDKNKILETQNKPDTFTGCLIFFLKTLSIIFFFVGILLLFVSIIDRLGYISKEATAIYPTQKELSKYPNLLKKKGALKHDRDTVYLYAVFKTEKGENVLTGAAGLDAEETNPGDKVTILYNPNDPTDVTLGFDDFFWIGLASFGFGIPLCFLFFGFKMVPSGQGGYILKKCW